MSTPQNPLNKYRSYNYHHLLYVCDSAVTAESLVLQDSTLKHGSIDQINVNENVFTQENNRIAYDLINGTPSSPEIDSHEKHRVPIHPRLSSLHSDIGYTMLLCNTATDSRITMPSVEFTSMLNSVNSYSDKEEDIISSAGVGKFQVKEFQGFRFFNVIRKFADASGAEGTMLTYVLKTYFVGITPDGRTELKANYTPLIFTVADVGTIFDESGALYDFTFGIVGHGSAMFNQAVSTFANGININFSVKDEAKVKEGTLISGKGLSLVQAIKKFESTLNDEYDTIKNKYFNSLPPEQKPEGEPVDIQYEISLAKEYQEKGYNFGEIQRSVDSDKGEEDPGIISFKKCYSIESALLKILKTSKKLVEEGKKPEKKPNTVANAQPKSNAADGEPEHEVDNSNTSESEERYVPKIISSVITGDKITKVAYEITRQPLTSNPTKKKEELTEEEKSDKAKTVHQIIKDRTLLLNYIFTGKNVDILDFDMNMKQSTAFFHAWLTASNDISKLESQAAQNGEKDGKSTGQAADTAVLKSGLPLSKRFPERKPLNILWPARIPKVKETDDSENYPDPVAMRDFMSTLQEFAGFGSMDAEVKIRGNPEFISALAVYPSDMSAELKDPNKKPPPSPEQLVYYDIVKKPTYCLIDVNMPQNDSYNFQNTQGEQLNKLIPFWYRGLYRIIAITNNFDNGEFTQKLRLVAFPDTQDFVKEIRKEKSETIIDRAKTIEQKAVGANVNVEDLIKNLHSTIKVASPNTKKEAFDPMSVQGAQARTTALAEDVASQAQSELSGLDRLLGKATNFVSDTAQQLNSAITSVNTAIAATTLTVQNEAFKIVGEVQSQINSILLPATQSVTKFVDQNIQPLVDQTVAKTFNIVQTGFESVFGQVNNPINSIDGLIDTAVDGVFGQVGLPSPIEDFFGSDIYDDLGFIGNNIKLGLTEGITKKLGFEDGQSITSLISEKTDIGSFAMKRLYDTNEQFAKLNIEMFSGATSKTLESLSFAQSQSSVLQRLAAQLAEVEYQPWSNAFPKKGIDVKSTSADADTADLAANLNAFFGTTRENIFIKNTVSEYYSSLAQASDLSNLKDTTLTEHAADEIRKSLSETQKGGLIRTLFGNDAYRQYTQKPDSFEEILRRQRGGDRILSTLQGDPRESRIDILAGSEGQAGSIFDKFGGVLRQTGLRSFDAFDNISTQLQHSARNIKNAISVTFGGGAEQFVTTSAAGGGRDPVAEGKKANESVVNLTDQPNTLGEVSASVSQQGTYGSVYVDTQNEIYDRVNQAYALDATDPTTVQILDDTTLEGKTRASLAAGDTKAKQDLENQSTSTTPTANVSESTSQQDEITTQIATRSEIFNITVNELYDITTVQTKLSNDVSQQFLLYGTTAKRKYDEMTVDERMSNNNVQNSIAFRVPYIGINNTHFIKLIAEKNQQDALAAIKKAGLEVSGS